ncbi:PqqD family protein [Streptomyces piniterrae]|uniref:PqqD family protein n=1 Tax=Streptomyces piniterrae TaxID=2571125 RepID=A0A4U0N862_9ACTN|nr:PqqD family peptide modification chaperone [Streptomyces piniterrae]TJZ49592.1 PqqD family protein [Streptomyces piniterrae]
MPLLQLTEQTVFDQADGAGILLDGAQGVYFELNPVATLMLDAALRYDTADEVVQHLRERIDAGDDTLREGIAALADQLAESHLAEPRSDPPAP